MYKIELQRWVDWWKDSRKRWWTLVILDATLVLLQLLQGAMWLKDGRYVLAAILLVSAGMMFCVTVRGMKAIWDISEIIVKLEGKWSGSE